MLKEFQKPGLSPQKTIAHQKRQPADHISEQSLDFVPTQQMNGRPSPSRPLCPSPLTFFVRPCLCRTERTDAI